MGANAKQSRLADKIIGANLRQFRKSIGLSQNELGEKVGITFQQIQKYENGYNRISASRLWDFCEILEVTPNDFFAGILNADYEANDTISTGIEIFSNPRGAKLAKAFVKIKNPKIETHLLEICRGFGSMD